MKTLYKQLEQFKHIKSNSQLLKKGFTTEQCIKDLFELMFDNLWSLHSPLREYVIFDKKDDIEKERVVYQKPFNFVKAPLKETGVAVQFQGILKKYSTGNDLYDYVMNIVCGYVSTEENLLNVLKLKCREISASAQQFDYTISPNDVPVLKGAYHTHNLQMTESGDQLSLFCKSSLSMYL
jgi:hypothetical protein